LLLSLGVAARGQSASAGPSARADSNSSVAPQDSPTAGAPASIKKVIFNLPEDQNRIWSSPFHLRVSDGAWVLPLAATTGILLAGDQHSMARAHFNSDAAHLSSRVANGGLAAIISLPASMYVWGTLKESPKARETGLLSGEALINSLAVNEALKLIFERERPALADGRGRFFQTSTNASFPSSHSILSWTAASVVAHEYPGGLTAVLAYGTATAVSITRVTGRQHFPSDVVVGAALGWLIGRQIFHAHHDKNMDSPYGAFIHDTGESDLSTLGSGFVPLDSWVYPALERLAALGYIRTQFTGLKPWTRRECIRQIEEAQYLTQDLPSDADVVQTIHSLKSEFSREGRYFRSAQIDSIYSRFMEIGGGPPLRDSYHFGQTVWNDFGRPYDQGGNFITGASASAVAGRFFFYVRGEYEHAPGRPALTLAQQDLIATLDSNPVQAPTPVQQTDRFYPLDMYAGVQMGQYALTFGKQSLWLGPGESGPLMLSDNAGPMYTLRLSRTSPLVLPSFLHFLGQVRAELIFAKLSGHQFPPRPFFNLQKLSFHPTRNLEIGFTRSSLWAGVGHPFTLNALYENFVSIGSPATGAADPGDRKSGFDFSYRLPGLRNWLTLYCDSYSDDDLSPLANPRHAAVNPGLYLSHFPKISKLDFRMEAVSTQALTATDRGGQFLYFNGDYHDSNTNKGFLFGNATGRDGKSYQLWSTYHFSAVTSLQLSYRDVKTSALFLPGGGTQSDASSRFTWQVSPQWSVDSSVQYERWLIPALHPGPQHNVLGSLQVTFRPHLQVHD
jgi:hypothetical protein